jgi:hypothetical protein
MSITDLQNTSSIPQANIMYKASILPFVTVITIVDVPHSIKLNPSITRLIFAIFKGLSLPKAKMFITGRNISERMIFKLCKYTNILQNTAKTAPRRAVIRSLKYLILFLKKAAVRYSSNQSKQKFITNTTSAYTVFKVLTAVLEFIITVSAEKKGRFMPHEIFF